MTFDALYITDADDDGHRVINAASLAEAKAILQAEMAAEGKTYHLDALIETKASFVART